MTDREFERLLDEIAGERAKITEQKPDPRFTETCYGKTPNGGDYSVAYYYDESGSPCLKQDATAVNIIEFTKDGERINLYIQKEQLSLLGDDGEPSIFAPIMIATLSTCAQLERDNISFRLQSGRKRYIENGGKLGRKPGSTKSSDQKKVEYKDVINLLRKGYSVRDVAKLSGKGISTVQRIKKEFVCL